MMRLSIEWQNQTCLCMDCATLIQAVAADGVGTPGVTGRSRAGAGGPSLPRARPHSTRRANSRREDSMLKVDNTLAAADSEGSGALMEDSAKMQGAIL